MDHKSTLNQQMSVQRNEQFSACCLYMSIYICPSMRRYWRAETWTSAVDGTMSHNQWDQITWGLHFIDNTKSDVTNYTDTWHDITKIPMDEKLCVDEQVISFKSTHSLMVYIKNKPRHRLQIPSGVWSFANCIQFRTKKVVPWVMCNVEVQMPSNVAMCDMWWPVPSTISHETENHVVCQCHNKILGYKDTLFRL